MATDSAVPADLELVVRIIAETAVANERYFGDLDSVVGDGDFGYSLARGFEIVLNDWDTLDRTDGATFLQKVAMIITGRIGGTSTSPANGRRRLSPTSSVCSRSASQATPIS